MHQCITLTPQERQSLLDWYRGHPNPDVRRRCQIILLLADGYIWLTIAAVLYCSSRTIARWQQRFRSGGLPALLGQRPGPAPRLDEHWIARLVSWVLQQTPRQFGFLRSRWCCAVLVLILWREYQLPVSRETVRRWLHRADLVWRRPRPVLRRRDPDREAKLQALRQMLLHLPDDETALFQDEVDVKRNPKIGCMWMKQGRPAEVVTPGDNEKCYLAGSLDWRSGRLYTTEGPQRDGALFVRHLQELRYRLRRYRKIEVLCDKALFHSECWAIWEFCHRHGDRVVLHFLPKYAPECNPIERVWWHLHEEITRNHSCQTLEELVALVLAWLTDRTYFQVEGSVYPKASAA